MYLSCRNHVAPRCVPKLRKMCSVALKHIEVHLFFSFSRRKSLNSCSCYEDVFLYKSSWKELILCKRDVYRYVFYHSLKHLFRIKNVHSFIWIFTSLYLGILCYVGIALLIWQYILILIELYVIGEILGIAYYSTHTYSWKIKAYISISCSIHIVLVAGWNEIL